MKVVMLYYTLLNITDTWNVRTWYQILSFILLINERKRSILYEEWCFRWMITSCLVIYFYPDIFCLPDTHSTELPLSTYDMTFLCQQLLLEQKTEKKLECNKNISSIIFYRIFKNCPLYQFWNTIQEKK